jgi:hypothetical protein
MLYHDIDLLKVLLMVVCADVDDIASEYGGCDSGRFRGGLAQDARQAEPGY